MTIDLEALKNLNSKVIPLKSADGAEFRIRPLSGTLMKRAQAEAGGSDVPQELVNDVLAHCVLEPEADAAEWNELLRLPQREELFDEILSLSTMTDKEIAKAKKNSESQDEDDSGE